MESYGGCHEEITGHKLIKAEAEAATQEEVQQFAEHNVYTQVLTHQCYDRNGKSPINARWVDINKGDDDSQEYRSRLMAKELKTDNSPDLFAAAPSFEAILQRRRHRGNRIPIQS